MKRKSIYLLLLICSVSMISFARQRCSDTGIIMEPASKEKAEEAETMTAKKVYDLSPVGFFVLNM